MKNKKPIFKYEYVIYFVMASFLLVSGVVKYSKNKYDITFDELSAAVTNDDKIQITVILDAGHGGEDCGAVAENGVLEKELNMLMCTQIRDILKLYGVETVLTRTEDKLLYTEEQNIKGQRKINDLKNRYLIATEYENALFVSVHMNKFSQSQYKGLQVYYSTNDQRSRILASDIQQQVKAIIQNDNNREIKKGNSTIYLLDRLQCPAVLIECGFLSNEEDTKQLSDPTYRKQLAFVICDAVLKNIDTENNNT